MQTPLPGGRPPLDTDSLVIWLWCTLGSQPPVDRRNDTRLWKYNLAQTSFADSKDGFSMHQKMFEWCVKLESIKICRSGAGGVTWNTNACETVWTSVKNWPGTASGRRSPCEGATSSSRRVVGVVVTVSVEHGRDELTVESPPRAEGFLVGPVCCGGDRAVGTASPAASPGSVLPLPVYSQLLPGRLERAHRGDHRILSRLHLAVRPLVRRGVPGGPVRVLSRGWVTWSPPVHPGDTCRVCSWMFGWFGRWLPNRWRLLIRVHVSLVSGSRRVAEHRLPVQRL